MQIHAFPIVYTDTVCFSHNLGENTRRHTSLSLSLSLSYTHIHTHMSRSSGDVAVAADANGAHLRSMQLQALLGLNEERLSKLKGFVVDKGPELLGDLFCPWAKWILSLLIYLINSDDGSLKLFIAYIFGMESPSPIKSPLQLIVSAWQTMASEEALRNAKCMAELRTDALVVCRAMIVMLIMVIGDIGWKWLIGFHIGLFVAQTNLQFSKEAPHLFFHAVHVFLYMLEAVAPTVFCRFLLPILGSVFAISLHSFPNGPGLTGWMLLQSVFVLFFYIPIWFGVCVMLAICARMFAVDHDLDTSTGWAMVMCTSLCGVHLVVYASAGGYCGALIVLLCPIVLISIIVEEDQQGMVRPLPLVCALISCLYTPFWVGLCFTSMVIFTLAAANDNVKAILWWFVSFAALHLLSYAFSRNFSVVAMCFMGSYFSYGCIL